jgi:hypothetical protein
MASSSAVLACPMIKGWLRCCYPIDPAHPIAELAAGSNPCRPMKGDCVWKSLCWMIHPLLRSSELRLFVMLMVQAASALQTLLQAPTVGACSRACGRQMQQTQLQLCWHSPVHQAVCCIYLPARWLLQQQLCSHLLPAVTAAAPAPAHQQPQSQPGWPHPQHTGRSCRMPRLENCWGLQTQHRTN